MYRIIYILSAMLVASSLASVVEQARLGGGAYFPLDDVFEKLVNQKLSEWHVPGISIAVVYNNKTYAKVSTGHALMYNQIH